MIWSLLWLNKMKTVLVMIRCLLLSTHHYLSDLGFFVIHSFSFFLFISTTGVYHISKEKKQVIKQYIPYHHIFFGFLQKFSSSSVTEFIEASHGRIPKCYIKHNKHIFKVTWWGPAEIRIISQVCPPETNKIIQSKKEIVSKQRGQLSRNLELWELGRGKRVWGRTRE